MVLGGIMLVVFGNDPVFKNDDLFIIGIGIVTIGIVLLAIGLLTLLVAYLLWKGNPAGWYLALILIILWIIDGILMLPAGILWLILAVILLWYFFRPKVRAFFGT